jgi:extracellular factor (EF) 3-hydroxypalmitic acid methyl ester biosynthesis protein
LYSQSQIDPLISFKNTVGESVRGTIVKLQRKSLVMEVYNPYSIVQISEVLGDLTIRIGNKVAYLGKAVVISLVNTGLTAVVSVTLIDEWQDLYDVVITPGAVGVEAKAFVQDWTERFQIRRDYQIVVNEFRAYLSDVSRWVEQVDLTESLPRVDGRLREDVFYELAVPLLEKLKIYFDAFVNEAALVDVEAAPAHRAYAQAALHPFLLRAPFVFRAFTKPLGYAGDHVMVSQMLEDPRQGPSTYFQIVNTGFLNADVVIAHRNRIDILVGFLISIAESAKKAGRPFRVLNVGCGPAVEIQRFLESYPNPEFLSFDLVDFSEETLARTRGILTGISEKVGKSIIINYIHESVHQLLKRSVDKSSPETKEYDAAYCAGLFDYFSDKVCSRLTSHFATRTRSKGRLLITNVHSSNPDKFGMEHLMEWYLIYRDEAQMKLLLPDDSTQHKVYVDGTGVNVFAEVVVA